MGAGLVAFMLYSLTNQAVKNDGLLSGAKKASSSKAGGGPQPVAASDEHDELYSDASGVKDRDPAEVCQVKPPEMISTSLLPSQTDALSDSDFMTISPDKLKNINFLHAGWSLGRDTTTNTMKNASHDLRSEPPNPKILNLENNSFSNTTIDYQPRRAFEPETAGRDLATDLSRSSGARSSVAKAGSFGR